MRRSVRCSVFRADPGELVSPVNQVCPRPRASPLPFLLIIVIVIALVIGPGRRSITIRRWNASSRRVRRQRGGRPAAEGPRLGQFARGKFQAWETWSDGVLESWSIARPRPSTSASEVSDGVTHQRARSARCTGKMLRKYSGGCAPAAPGRLAKSRSVLHTPSRSHLVVYA